MARLQKKKVSSDKTRKREASSGVSVNEKNSPAASSVKAGQKRGENRPAAAPVVPSDPNFIQKGLEFLREVRVELKKVTWPSRKQTAGSTLVVIILVFILGAFLGLVDISLSKLVQIVLA
ncbi:preprotein translocase subunit SecE [Desulfocicer vacuolatum DSM 3385]|uniref:Protein translocase subunit SecE n=1 Tax=Desulfocicer vacuolatum DSM 3385 TaxID=1121400 RepID=A0A1W1YJ61_9BACT|nr:preprotein translocase subunit SecE [Desulfocicer vacuolatum]SMC36174.1 preprotein translocase subunit SecE [Desulfocicer vacuolatum DSM 3385]